MHAADHGNIVRQLSVILFLDRKVSILWLSSGIDVQCSSLQLFHDRVRMIGPL